MTSNHDTSLDTVDRQALLAELDALLQAQPGIDAGERETTLRHFEDALQNPSAVMGDSKQVGPDRTQWIQTLDFLRENHVLGAGECDDLIQRFDEAMQGLQSEPVRLAAEFAQRCQQEGETKAREWLTQRLRSPAQPGRPEAAPAHVTLSMQRKPS